jgi:hypothetical protein
LQQADFNMVLPSEGIKPLDLIMMKSKNVFSFFKQTEGNLLGASLKDMFLLKEGSKLPKTKENALPQNLAGSDIVKGESHFAAGFLSKANATAGTSTNKTMLFTFKDAKEIMVNQIQLDEFLQFSQLNENAPTFAEAVKEEKMFIITSVLVSKELGLRNADDFTVSGTVDANALNTFVKANAGGSYSGNESYRISSKGDVPLVFAIKTVRILFDKGKYRIKPETINVRGKDGEYNFVLEEGEIAFE